MPAHMKMPGTRAKMATVTAKSSSGERTSVFKIPKTALTSFMETLRKIGTPVREWDSVPVDEVFKHLDKKYGLAIWIQIYLGLRVGELIALRWEDIDLETGRIHIRRTYVTKTGLFREYPKGGKHHSHSIPVELVEKLSAAKKEATSPMVVTSPHSNRLPYKWYVKYLKEYCSELALPQIATHGLRHSTSELYIHHGATRDDLRKLFAHSAAHVTDRYIHDRGTNRLLSVRGGRQGVR